jgi:hypothetical protein
MLENCLRVSGSFRMVCQPCRFGPRAERGEGALVELGALDRVERLLHGLPGQLMAERDAAVVGSEDTGGEALLETLLPGTQNLLEDRQLGPGNGHSLCDVARVLAQTGDAANTASRMLADTPVPPAASASVTKKAFPPVSR